MERDFKGIWIPKEIWLDNRLNVTEKALFAEINSLDTENHCTASNDYFSKFFDVSESTITRGIAHLKELGLIESEFDGRVRKLRVVKLTTLPRQIDEQINISSISTNISNTINTNISNNTNKNNTFNITANFPNANSMAEIQEAILTLPTLASQFLSQR